MLHLRTKRVAFSPYSQRTAISPRHLSPRDSSAQNVSLSINATRTDTKESQLVKTWLKKMKKKLAHSAIGRFGLNIKRGSRNQIWGLRESIDFENEGFRKLTLKSWEIYSSLLNSLLLKVRDWLHLLFKVPNNWYWKDKKEIDYV